MRGPFVVLPTHRGACSTTGDVADLVAAARRADPDARFAIDLFSGAGGLSLGLHRAGFQVVLGADHYPEAVETHAHHFPGLSVDWDLADVELIERVAALVRDNGIDLVAGGPPCQPFSKAGRSLIRHLVREGGREPHDRRRDLWRSFMEVVRLSLPRAVLMENVPDMALDKEMFILRAMVQELEDLGYSVSEKVVDTWRYGVPQFRQRLILVALRDGLRFTWPAESPDRVSVWNAIGDLPEVEGGWRPEGGAMGWADYPGPVTGFQKRMRDGVADGDRAKVFDHITRPVRPDDAEAFGMMDSTTKYSDLPAKFRRYRDDIFDDKYKRLDENGLSRTITAHIAKDGYWYIHPRQGRTLTVREAARLQTFPDWYRFAGPPSAAFKQIGNAVPPLLAEQLGVAVAAALDRAVPATADTRAVAAALTGWFGSRGELAVPWLRAETRWQAVAAGLLLDRADPGHVRLLWPLFQRWSEPGSTTAEEDALRQIGTLMGRAHRVSTVLEMADWLTEHPGALEEPDLDHRLVPGLPEHLSDLAVLAVPVAGEDASDEPVLVTRGVLRVAGRFIGEPVDRKNKLTDGRLAVARMIGGGANARSAHLGLIELASTLCRPVDPLCTECPLQAWCVESTAEQQRQEQLF